MKEKYIQMNELIKILKSASRHRSVNPYIEGDGEVEQDCIRLPIAQNLDQIYRHTNGEGKGGPSPAEGMGAKILPR